MLYSFPLHLVVVGLGWSVGIHLVAIGQLLALVIMVHIILFLRKMHKSILLTYYGIQIVVMDILSVSSKMSDNSARTT